MTDTSPVATTQPITEPYPVTVPLNSPVVNGAVSDSAAPEEEEPYTIKCICSFEDDDGNTVFCEGCETWQHIECYYHGQDVPEVHNCADCEPRSLDGRRATERQRRLREQSDGGDRKAKRSGAKTQKKKPKEHGDQVNGFHHRSESGARDHHPAKKTKTSHRASGSINSMSGLPSLQPDARKRSATSMSPTKPPGPSIPLYSNEFLQLYERDQGHANMDSNLFVNLPLAADLASWVTEPSALARVANGRSAQDIFTWSGAAIDRSRWPSLSTESITDSLVEVDGKHPTWKILKTENRVSKDEIVGEITGKIGMLRDYCLDPSNRWQELRHPEPFVFFHPQLPIYIDSRHEGSILRYVRRSCRPNVTMKTYITNEVEYHFCFVAKEDIAADSEITAMWYLDPQLFESTNGVVKQESSDNAQDLAAICISNVLAHFGGCACSPSMPCLLSSVDRRRYPKALDPSAKPSAAARRKKTKSKSNISPPATNSRAGSETTKNVEEEDPTESRSASGSARGHTQSRDLTPTFQTPTEGNGFGDTELSAREKRKIAAAEKKFQQLEHDQQTSHKRKKRASGPTTQTTPGPHDRQSHSPPLTISTGSTSLARHGSPRRTSGQSNPPVRSPRGRQPYVDSAIQTEPDISDGQSLPSQSSPRRPSFVSLTQRLLKRCYSDRVRLEQRQQSPISPSQQNLISHLASPSSSPHGAPPTATTPSVSGAKEDVDMKDVDSPLGLSPAQQSPRDLGSSPLSSRSSAKPPLPPPWPSTAAHNTRIPGSSRVGGQPDAQGPLSSATVPSTSPKSATPSVLSSPPTLEPPQHNAAPPGSGVTAPSPAKKKLSLGDYLIRRGTLTTPTSEKPPTPVTAMPPPKSPPSHPPANHDAATTHKDNSRPKDQTTGDGGAAKLDASSPDVTMKDVPELTRPSQLPPLP